MNTINYRALTRISAFLAVSIAIAAVSWLINDYALLAIGVLGLGAGHYYSWKRPEASLLRSLILLAFMVLTVYLGGDLLRTGLSDRLLLSRYLIYGLVIGSFDLMRRRNVMASLVLGILLMVLISELALDLRFLAFVIPFIVLIIISSAAGHAEHETENTRPVSELSWPRIIRPWLAVGSVILLVTMVIFLIMPRVASSQVRQASWLPSRLDLTLSAPISLPGRPGAPVEPGIFPFTESGESTAGGRYVPLGYAGSEADRVVMNVRSRISSYWRGLTLDTYDGRGWLSAAGGPELRSDGEGGFLLPDSRTDARNARNYWQVFYMLSPQPNAVFTGYNPGTLYLPRDEIVLDEGTLYRSVSVLPYIRPEPLRRDFAPDVSFFDYDMPDITERTAQLAESIVEGAPTDYDKAARLERYLIANYPYSLDAGPVPEGRDAVDYFLFEQQEGYCSHFATAMAVMARHVGLPARVAAGYLPGYIDPLTGAHIVRVGDAHAWVEIFFERHGWVAFDPTPRADAAMGFATGHNLVYFGLDDLTGKSLTEVFAPIINGISIEAPTPGFWLWALAAVLAGIGLFFAARIYRGRTPGLKPAFVYSRLDGEDRRKALKLYDRMIRILGRKGLPRRGQNQTLQEYSALISGGMPEAVSLVDEITALALRAAYNPAPFISKDLGEFKRRLSSLKKL